MDEAKPIPTTAQAIRTMDINQIMAVIPHRFPFLLIDRVYVIEESKYAIGRKCVTMNEHFFQGHFPGHPIMPGVLIIEALAQTACALMFSKPEMKNKLAFFMGIDEVKFRKPVTPGDVVELHVEMLRMGSRAGRAKGVGRVNGETATEGEFSFAIADRTWEDERLSIHASAVIDPSAEIGANVSIGPFAVIGPKVKLGDGCKIHSHAVVEHTTLGANCEVFPHAVIGLQAQHLRYKGEPARVEVGDGTVFREYVSVHRGTPFDASGTSTTFIGSNCYFMGSSHIAHDCKVGNNVITANSAMLAGHVELGDNAFMSGMAGLHQYVRAGKCVMISGGSMVPFDIAPFCIVQGDRASIRGINVVGMRRMGFDRNAIRLIKDAYRAMFLSALRLEDALKAPELNVDNPAVKIFRDFLSVPKRGVLRPPAGMRVIETEEAAT